MLVLKIWDNPRMVLMMLMMTAIVSGCKPLYFVNYHLRKYSEAELVISSWYRLLPSIGFGPAETRWDHF